MKIYITTILSLMSILLGVLSANAQQDSQYTQYMYNTVAFNPAYAGNRGTLTAMSTYRNQWVGLDGAPETLNFSLHSPISISRVALGLGFVSDKIGPSTESTIAADFAYSFPVDKKGTKLAFGVKAGVNIFNIDVDKLTIYDPNDVNLANRTVTSPVVGLGLYLHTDQWYMGLSTPNILETEHYDDIKVSTAKEKMHLYLTAGYVFDLNSDLKFKPAVLAKATSGAPLSVDLSGNFLIYEKLTLGMAYRWDAAVSALAGFQVSDHLMIGYSYDYETTELSRYNDGSHEVFLRFELGTRTRGVVNPRFF